MNYGAVAQGKLVSTTGGQLEPVLRSKGQMCTAVSGAPSRMGPMFRSAPQVVHTVVPEQAVVPICVPEQCMLVLSVAGTWRSDWRHVLASMANTKHTAPVGRSSSPPIAWCGCCADFCFQHWKKLPHPAAKCHARRHLQQHVSAVSHFYRPLTCAMAGNRPPEAPEGPLAQACIVFWPVSSCNWRLT